MLSFQSVIETIQPPEDEWRCVCVASNCGGHANLQLRGVIKINCPLKGDTFGGLNLKITTITIVLILGEYTFVLLFCCLVVITNTTFILQ